MFFTITQKDYAVLNYIKIKFRFGRIQSNTGPKKNCFTYNVYRYDNLTSLIHLFNGHLHLNKTRERFSKWVNFYNKSNVFITFVKHSILIIKRKPQLNLISH